MQEQRFLFTFTPDIDTDSQPISIGVIAKKYNQARAKVYQHLIDIGYQVDEGVSRLEGKPSNKSADYEIQEGDV